MVFSVGQRSLSQKPENWSRQDEKSQRLAVNDSNRWVGFHLDRTDLKDTHPRHLILLLEPDRDITPILASKDVMQFFGNSEIFN